MSKELDNIIKEELVKNIQIFNEDGKALKVYPKIAGLINLGRTYFVSGEEINKHNQEAQAQMAQKYGSEIYGLSSKLAGQTTNGGSKSGTDTGRGSVDSQSLIRCTVNPFLVIPDKGFKESSQNKDNNVVEKLDGILNAANSDSVFSNDKDNIEDIANLQKYKNVLSGSSVDQNSKEVKQAIKNIQKIFGKQNWKGTSIFGTSIVELNKTIKDWQKGIPKSNSSGMENKPKQSAMGDWNPNYTFRIDIQTNFNEQWFKRKFKSGFFNRALFAIKNDIYSHSTNDDVKNKKFSANDMNPSDQKKLDSIQWKMTNKVAKDYITLLLGWSRSKQIRKDTMMPIEQTLKEDSGFGEKMASKALDNRGILGRLKQKLFSGGQNSNTISVVFQLADPNEWEQVDPPHDTNSIDTSDKTLSNQKLASESFCLSDEAFEKLALDVMVEDGMIHQDLVSEYIDFRIRGSL